MYFGIFMHYFAYFTVFMLTLIKCGDYVEILRFTCFWSAFC